MNFVVQKENFRQMRDFVELAERMQADEVSFRRIRNFGTFSIDSLIENDVFLEENPHYEEAVQTLSWLKQNSTLKISDNCLTQDNLSED